MTDMSLGFRGRLQDGVINWQETRYRKSEERQQHADIRRSRMTCSADLPGIRQTQDWTGSMAMSSSGRFQVIEEKKPKARIISGDGNPVEYRADDFGSCKRDPLCCPACRSGRNRKFRQDDCKA